MNVYTQFGLEPIINAAGASTRVGGPLMHPAAAKAMLEAAGSCIALDQLQAAASRIIAETTGAEAGYVTAGAAAGLTLAAAACLAKLDIAIMDRLPDTSGLPNEIVISREQRNGYDHALRAAGAQLVEVGMNELVAGAGVRRTEVWEYDAAITDRTVAVAYFANPDSAPPVEEVASLCQQRGVPLIVDAAGQLPPAANLRRFVDAGADLVTFSGGKGLRGPQSSGILAGRRDLIMSAALQQLDLDEHWSVWDPPQNLIVTHFAFPASTGSTCARPMSSSRRSPRSSCARAKPKALAAGRPAWRWPTSRRPAFAGIRDAGFGGRGRAPGPRWRTAYAHVRRSARLTSSASAIC